MVLKTTPSRTSSSGTGNTFFSFLLMIALVTVLFLFAAGFQFADNLSSISSLFFQKIRQLFTFSPLLPSTNPEPSLISQLLSQPPSYSRVASVPDLESGLNLEDKHIKREKYDYDSESDSDSESKCKMIGVKLQNQESKCKMIGVKLQNQESSYLFPTLLSDSTHDFIKEDARQDLEIEMVNSAPTPMPLSVPSYKSLDMVIEKPTKSSTTPKATYEEWQEPIPIDEDNVPEDINGWCFIGQSKGARACAPVGKMDKCTTGEVYANQMQCLQIHPDDAPVPSEYFPTFPPSLL